LVPPLEFAPASGDAHAAFITRFQLGLSPRIARPPAPAVRLQLAGYRRKPSPGESAVELVKRLAEQKARALAASHPAHLIIGSDQVAVLGERIIGKPTPSKGREQLLAASGSSVTFLTGLALLNSQTGHCQVDCVPFTVHAHLDAAHRALPAPEQPYDCAGSFKAEGLGVSLFQSTEGLTPPA
jgi:predicted house-cleaning NTP pyrophosphatase (Maf/HAM1 superfamily)